MLLGIVHDRALELGREHVAHDANREVGLLEDQRRRGRLFDALLEHLVELEQVQQLALQIGALGALGGRPDDRASALQVELGGLLAEPLALLVVEPSRHAYALAERRVDHVAARDREFHRQPRALRLQGVLDHLDDDVLAGLQQICDLTPLTSRPAPPPRGIDAGEDDLIDVQEAVLLEPDVDERRLQPREHVVDAPLVDVADDRAVAAALQVELRYAVAGVGAACLTAPTAPAGCVGRRRLRGDLPGGLQQRDPRFPTVDADQYLLLQLSFSPLSLWGRPCDGLVSRRALARGCGSRHERSAFSSGRHACLYMY